MSIKVQTWVWDHAPVKGGDLLVLLKIADYARDDGSNAYPSMETLANRCRLSHRQTRRIVRNLERAGCIRVTRTGRKGYANVYHVVMTEELARKREDIMTPLVETEPELRGTPVTGRGSPMASKGDTGDPPSIIEPSKEPSECSPPPSRSPKKKRPEPGTSRFDHWYERYPRKVARGAAEKAWNRINPTDDLFEMIMEATIIQTERVFARMEKRFVPHPATWLNQKRWLDAVPDTDQEEDDWRSAWLDDDETWSQDETDDGVIDVTFTETSDD